MKRKMVRESYPPEYGIELVQVRLPAPLKQQLVQYASNHHQSMTQVVQEALEGLLKPVIPTKESGFCGTWVDSRSADEIIEDIRSHRRSSKRQIEF